MKWEAPSFVEVKMDAEINSYQDDFKDIPDVQERSPEVLGTPPPQE
jgi:coenzyme PQQ precursor peptide PqqA